jgi:type I restriction enzyme S subunit
MITAPATPRAFAVWFKDLDRWSVSSFFKMGWKWPAEVIRPLSAALERRYAPVDRAKVEFADLKLVTLHFGGDMEPRDLNGKVNFKGKLFNAFAGDVVYSKIDVRNGAIGVVPTSMPTVAVSSEYPVYRVRADVALPEYVKLLFRTAAFRQQINSMISGASGRKRVQPSDLEEIEVPLPSLPVQEVIVRRWQEGQDAVGKARQAVAKIEKDILTGFFKSLGLEPPKAADTPKAFAVWWKDFLRWSVSYNQAALSSIDFSRGKYPVVDLGTVLSLVQYGTSEKANPAGKGTPVLRINNIKEGTIDLSALKHIALAKKPLANLILADGDILIIRTSGSRDLVGTCGVFHAEGEYVFASYLIRLRAFADKAAPDFLAYFLNSPLGRQQINAVSRQIMQNNINTQELRQLRVCLPPLDAQRGIVGMVSKRRAEIAAARQVAAKKSAEIAQEVEQMILGTRPVKPGRA